MDRQVINTYDNKKQEFLQNISRISNMSEFNIYSSESKVLISKNLKYGVFWNKSMVAVIDLDKKDVVSKYLNDMNQTTTKIKKLKLTETNNCVYLKQSSNTYDLVISSIDFLGEHFELSFTDEILEFLYAESVQHSAEYIFLLNNKGELKFIQNFFDLDQTIKVNILKDCNINANVLKSKCEMIFIEETDTLILFFSNGMIITYSISSNPEKMKDEKNIFFEEMINLNRNESSINLGSNMYNLIKFHIIRIDEKENSVNMNIDEEIELKRGIFIIFNYTVDQTDTVISIFNIHLNRLIVYNHFIDNFKNKTLIDSYLFESIENSYLIVAIRVGEKIELHKAVVLDMTDNREDEDENNNLLTFTKITEYEEPNKQLVCVKILGAYINYFKNNEKISGEFEEERNSINLGQNEINDFSVNVFVRRLLNINDNHYISDCEIPNFPVNSDLSNNLLNMQYSASDEAELNDELYFEKCFDVEKINKDLLEQYFHKIIYNMHNFLKEKFLNISNKDVDFFLLSLIFNNKIFMLRNYLFLKKNNNEYLVSNEKILKTVEPLIITLKSVITDKIEVNINDPFLNDINLKSSLEILTYVFKVIKSHLMDPIRKPFESEETMQKEELQSANTGIENVEKLLLTVKIIRSYLNNVYHKEENFNEEKLITNNFHKRKNFLGKQSVKSLSCVLEIIIGNIESFPNMKIIIKNILNDENYTQFQLFFYYFYFIFDLLLTKYTENYKNLNNSNNSEQMMLSEIRSTNFDLKKGICFILNDNKFRTEFKSIFIELLDEYEKYKEICETLYSLDLNLILKENNASLFTIDTLILSNFFDLVSSENLIKPTQNNQQTLFNLIINFLSVMNYNKEALLISRKLILLSPELEDLRIQLIILLESNLNQHAFIFLDSCFASFLYSPNNFKDETDIIKKLKAMPEFKDYKSLSFTFFEYLLNNDNLQFLISLPFNFIEKELFLEFLNSKSEYEEVMLCYLLKSNKVVSARLYFDQKIYSSSTVSSDQKAIYSGLICDLELIENNSNAYHKGKLVNNTHYNFKVDGLEKSSKKSLNTILINEEKMDFYNKNGNLLF